MKSIVKNLLVAAAVLFSVASSHANTNPTLRLDEGKVLVVNLNDWTNTNVTIAIKDLGGILLHSDKFQSKSSIGRKYNLKNLPTGNYTLIIESMTKKAVHTLEVSDTDVKMKSFREVLIFKPMVKIENNSVALNQLSLGRDISVSISDRDGAFFTAEYNDMSTVNKRFDISDLPTGIYVFAVESENQYDTFVFVK